MEMNLILMNRDHLRQLEKTIMPLFLVSSWALHPDPVISQEAPLHRLPDLKE